MMKVLTAVVTLIGGGIIYGFSFIGVMATFGVIENSAQPINSDELGAMAPIKGQAVEWSGPLSNYASDAHNIPPPGKLQGDIRAVVEFVAPEMVIAACDNQIAAA